MGTLPTIDETRPDAAATAGILFLDKVMPFPVLGTGLYACWVSGWVPLGLAILGVILVFNLVLNVVHPRRLAAGWTGLVPATWFRMAVNSGLVLLQGWACGTWLPSLPMLLAIPFAWSGRMAVGTSILLMLGTAGVQVATGVESAELLEAMIVLAVAASISIRMARAQFEWTQQLIAMKNELGRVAEHADQASRAKSAFLAQMSHEIRTPLNGVIGSLDLLSRSRSTDESDKLLTAAQVSADGLLDLIGDVLDFSRVEAGALEMASEPTDLERLRTQVHNAFGAIAADKGLALEVDRAADVPRFGLCDPLRLRQMVFNLVGNAMKFTDAGEVRVGITSELGGVRVSVSDTGRGIAPEALNRIFSPFEQARAGAPGTGLGLAIVKRFAELLGGRITVTSREGAGSTFSLHLPWEPAAPPASPERREPAASGEGLTVLVVEDNPLNQRIASAMLASLGCEVAFASTGESGVERAVEAPVDVILMDIQLPGIDGCEAAARIRAAGVTVPIFALSAAASLEDRERAHAVGMDGYLTKPFKLERLAEALSDLRPVGSGELAVRP